MFLQFHVTQQFAASTTVPKYLQLTQYNDSTCADVTAVLTLAVNDGSCRQLAHATWIAVITDVGADDVTRVRLLRYADKNCATAVLSTVAAADFPALSEDCRRDPVANVYWHAQFSEDHRSRILAASSGVAVEVRGDGDDDDDYRPLLQTLHVAPGACAYNPFAQVFYTIRTTCEANKLSASVFGELVTFTPTRPHSGDIADTCR